MKGSIAKGAAWVLLFRVVDRSLGFISMLVLARLLLPADFGLIAMANSVVAVVELASAFSFEIALIQKAKPERRHFDTAWTLNVLLGAICALGIALLSYPTAAFYGETRLIPVMFVSAATLLLGSAENIGVVEFRRSMNFQSEFHLLAMKRVLGFVVTIVAAFLLRTYWALLAGIVAGRFFGVVLSYTMQPYRPRFALSAWRELLGFSQWMLFNNAILVGIVRIPHFVVGKLQGPQALGLYVIGSEIGELPISELAAPVNRAALPGYARLVDDRERLKATFLDVGSAVLLLALPAAIGLAVVAEPLVRVVLGEKWLDAVPIVQVLAAAGVLIAAVANNGSACVALGEPLLAAWFSFVRLVVLAVAIGVLVPKNGVLGAAWAELLGSAACLAVSYVLAFRLLKLRWREYAAQNWRLVVASLAMGLVVRTLIDSIGSSDMAVTQLLLGVLAGAAVYVLLLLTLWHLSGRPQGAEYHVLSRAVDYVRGLRDYLRSR
jgi:PST family polysaccharide transporter